MSERTQSEAGIAAIRKRVLYSHGYHARKTAAMIGPTIAPLLSIALWKPKLLPVSQGLMEALIRLSRGAALSHFPTRSMNLSQST